MGKLAPAERWRRHVMERFVAFERSGELQRLRVEGLSILKRKRLYTGKEWWQTFHRRASSARYQEWNKRCEIVGQRFGLAPWTVTLACLIKGYKPDQSPFPIESMQPRVTLVTGISDTQFIVRLAHEAQKRGLHLVQRFGAVENAHSVTMTEKPPPLPSSMPPQLDAFHIRVETPVGYPPEAAKQLQADAGSLARQILVSLGYRPYRRLRASSLVRMAKDLKVGERLASGGSYDIIEDVYETQDLKLDQQRRKQVKSRRHRLGRRLVDPHIREDDGTPGESGPPSPTG